MKPGLNGLDAELIHYFVLRWANVDGIGAGIYYLLFIFFIMKWLLSSTAPENVWIVFTLARLAVVVCLSVCLPQVDVLLKLLNVGSRK